MEGRIKNFNPSDWKVLHHGTGEEIPEESLCFADLKKWGGDRTADKKFGSPPFVISCLHNVSGQNILVASG